MFISTMVVKMFLVFIMAWLITLLLRDKILAMIVSSGFVRPNFKGENIPLAAGIVFFIAALILTAPLYLLGLANDWDQIWIFLFLVTGATCLGLLDDFWGDRQASGLKGHFKALWQGRLTTGACKAIGGGFIALMVAAYLYPGDIIKIIDSTLIIALSANLINLFDLRPGRAGKVYILLYLILLPVFWERPESIGVTIMLGSLIAFLPVDLKARAMMGDVGSNTLGMVIGFTAAACLQGPFRVAFLVILIVIHIITERYSLTRIIAQNAVLNYLDLLGRDKK